MAEAPTRETRLRAIIEKIRAAGSEPSLLSSLLDEYERDFGLEANKEVLDIIGRDTQESWKQMAEEQKSNSIEDLLDALWGSFKDAGGEFTIKRTRAGVQVHCTRCPMADTYENIGRQDYGLVFHCSTDPHIVQGFNNKIVFRISKRLMSGDDCCNHSYSMRS